MYEYSKKSDLAGTTAKVLNAGGSAVLSAYDLSSAFIDKIYFTVKKTPELPKKAKEMATEGLEWVKSNDRKKMESKIRKYEDKIKELYYEIGKESAETSKITRPLETDSIKKLIGEVKGYKNKIQIVKNQIAEIEEKKKAEELKKEEERLAKKKGKEKHTEVANAVKAEIEKTKETGTFKKPLEQAVFEKIANDLLNSEMDIKILAAAELGKMRNKAALPVLHKAAKFDNPYLTSEIINSLINIGGPRSIPFFREHVTDKDMRVRIGCLQGLYKMADDNVLTPILVNALRDEDAEVRITAATLIGWRENKDFVPVLIQCLNDKKEKVRKAAISALSHIKDKASVPSLIELLQDKSLEIREKAFCGIKAITGKDIAINVHASKKELSKAVENLKDWWEKEGLGKVDVRIPEEAGAVTGTEEPELTEKKLKRMTKTQLLFMCKDRKINCDKSMTKAELIKLILPATFEAKGEKPGKVQKKEFASKTRVEAKTKKAPKKSRSKGIRKYQGKK